MGHSWLPRPQPGPPPPWAPWIVPWPLPWHLPVFVTPSQGWWSVPVALTLSRFFPLLIVMPALPTLLTLLNTSTISGITNSRGGWHNFTNSPTVGSTFSSHLPALKWNYVLSDVEFLMRDSIVGSSTVTEWHVYVTKVPMHGHQSSDLISYNLVDCLVNIIIVSL